MSYDATDWAMKQRPKSAPEKSVLLCLAYYHRRDTDLCFVSATKVAEVAILTEKTVRTCIKSLIDQGLISAQYRPGKAPLFEFNWELTPEPLTGVPRNALPGSHKDTPEPLTGAPRKLTPQPRNVLPDTPVTVTDEQGINKVNKGEGWQPPAAALDALRTELKNPEFEIPDSWLPIFRIHCAEKSKSMNAAYFIEWSKYQFVKDQKFDAAKREIPDASDEKRPPSSMRRPYESPVHVDTPQQKLAHARLMHAKFQDNPTQRALWAAEILKFQNQIQQGGGSDGHQS